MTGAEREQTTELLPLRVRLLCWERLTKSKERRDHQQGRQIHLP